MSQDVALITDLPHPHLLPYAVIGAFAFLSDYKIKLSPNNNDDIIIAKIIK